MLHILKQMNLANSFFAKWSLMPDKNIRVVSYFIICNYSYELFLGSSDPNVPSVWSTENKDRRCKYFVEASIWKNFECSGYLFLQPKSS